MKLKKIEKIERELYENYRENVQSLYIENIDLIFDALKKLKGEELNDLFNIIKYKYRN